MFYGKNITEDGFIINVQSGFMPFVYSDTFIEITEEEYNDFIKTKKLEHLAHKEAIKNKYGEEIIEKEQEIKISELEKAIRRKLKEAEDNED